jgi:transposase
MCIIFKAAARASLPDATLVVDRFHVVQLANAALTEVRRRVTVQQRGRRGRKGNREWELRNRLTRPAARIHAKHLDPMVDDLKALPKKIGAPILAAWNAKEDLMDLLAHAYEPRPQPDRATTVPLLRSLRRRRPTRAGTPRHHRADLAAADRSAIVSGVNNAVSEGTNPAIKTDARAAYGYRNPNQRLRARCATTRRSRGHLSTHTSGKHGQPR